MSYWLPSRLLLLTPCLLLSLALITHKHFRYIYWGALARLCEISPTTTHTTSTTMNNELPSSCHIDSHLVTLLLLTPCLLLSLSLITHSYTHSSLSSCTHTLLLISTYHVLCCCLLLVSLSPHFSFILFLSSIVLSLTLSTIIIISLLVTSSNHWLSFCYSFVPCCHYHRLFLLTLFPVAPLRSPAPCVVAFES